MFTDNLKDLVEHFKNNDDLAVTTELYDELELRGYHGYERDLAYRYILNEVNN